jgi:hypothetical protein
MLVGESKTYSLETFLFSPLRLSPYGWSLDDLAAKIFVASAEIENVTFLIKGAFHLHIITEPRILTPSEREEIEEIRLSGYQFTYEGSEA